MADDPKKWAWFCTETNDSRGGDNGDGGDINECMVNICTCFLHLAFIVVAAFVLVYTRYGPVNDRFNDRYLIRWPGHIYRWLLIFTLLVCALASLGEGILTEMVRKEGGGTQLQFYLPSCFLFLASVVSLYYYNLVEKWSAPRLCWLLVLYWLGGIGVNGARIALLYRTSDIDAVILWLAVLMLVIYFFLLFLELNLVPLKCMVCQVHGPQSINTREMKYHMRYTEHYVSFLYYVTFWWMNWLFRLGYSRPLVVNDLGTLPDNHGSQHLYQIFKMEFQKELEYKASIGQKPSVWKVFARVYKWDIIYAGLARLVYDIGCLVGPLALNGLIIYVINYGQTSIEKHQYVTITEFFSNGYILVGVIFIANIVQYFSHQQNLYISNVIGVHIRTSLQTMVYDKSLRLSSYSISGGSMTVGQITNHMSIDAFNLFFFSQRMHYLWAVPFRLITVFLLMYLQIELTVLLALAVLVLTVPTLLLIARLQTKTQKTVMKHSDERLKRSNEMLLGMKLLKLYGWEEMFCNFIEAVRKLEMSAIFKYNGCYCFSVCVVQTVPAIMQLAVFAAYPFITGENLEPNVAFSTLSLMNLLGEPLYFVPMVTSLLVNAFVGMSRMQTFFLAPEAERCREVEWTDYLSDNKKKTTSRMRKNKAVTETTPLFNGTAGTTDYESVFSQTDEEATRSLNRSKDSFALKIQNGAFAWSLDSSVPILQDIDLVIPSGEVTMVVGSVGSGKSSLLSAMLGEMTTLRGSVTFGIETDTNASLSTTGIAYGAQKAWLMNATLRDNITFGQLYNQGRYRKVIEASALKPDIDILPGGDMTEIGEKGINLSGGQKQRISVARAMYSSKPLVLLDDPLSALDVNVGGHLFRDGIMGRLRKAKRTVVLVTHQLQYLQQAEKIIVMKEGRISFQGTFDDIARDEPELYKRWQNDVIAATDSELSGSGLSGEESTREERAALMKQVSLIKSMEISKSTLSFAENETGHLIEKEELARGSVALDIYWYYFSNMGILWALPFLLLCITLEGLNVARNFMLTDWSEAGLHNRTVEDINEEYLGPYVGLACAYMALSLVSAICTVSATWNAANTIYSRMLHNITRTPLRFFDTTPIGRILNRFSSDTQIIDTKLIITVSITLWCFWSFTFALLVNTIITPIFLAEVSPIIIIYIVLAVYFIRSSRELQRLDSVTRSPVFAHFSETLGGLTTIRAYRDEKRFFVNCLKRIDTNNKVFLYLQASYGWLGLQMSICGGFMVLMVGLTTVLQATVFGNLDSSMVGLAFSYVLMITLQLFNLIRFMADTEMQMNPVERAQYYTKVPIEDYSGSEPPSDWPSKGEIKLDRISVRYADTLPPVINNVSLYVRPGEKVGICGRTGSGKSSLTLALLRIIKTFKGSIVIDGEDIAGLPLTTLRQRLSIIPQDPILFTGTIRSNLDPHETKSDEDLWGALEIAQLKQRVSDLSLSLGTIVSEGGENFSVGQRQLFCLARAFLRDSRVLIMDEATASIDYDTEKLLQEVVASAFKDKTVLTIAHRVSTIRESDTIWVLRDGEIIECDSPENLLAREDSEYYSMVVANK